MDLLGRLVNESITMQYRQDRLALSIGELIRRCCSRLRMLIAGATTSSCLGGSVHRGPTDPRQLAGLPRRDLSGNQQRVGIF